MSEEKKNRKKAKHRLKRKMKQHERRREASPSVDARFVKSDIQREIRYITQRAQVEDARIVQVMNLVLFSTRSRDAWVLDPEDDFAMCVCRDGAPQPTRILDTPETLSIDWPVNFTIEGERFIVIEKSGRIVQITGYPTAEISAACGIG